jgi:hypothetical protein
MSFGLFFSLGEKLCLNFDRIGPQFGRFFTVSSGHPGGQQITLIRIISTSRADFVSCVLVLSEAQP